jgi:phage gpG-like protein
LTTFIHTLLGARPPARTDGVAWSQVRIEHAESEDGPWSIDATQSLTPLDSNPREPGKRDLTFGSSLAEAYFRLIFLDGASGESTPTEPAFDDGSGIEWKATVADVAAILRARTYVDSGEVEGIFNEETRPTATQVNVLIVKAGNEVRARIGTDDIPTEDLRAYARNVVAIRAAMWVELSYFPEQADEDATTTYKELRELYEEEHLLAPHALGCLRRVPDLGVVAVSVAQIEAEGTTQVETHLKEFGSRATDARPAMRKVRTIMEQANRRNFETSGSYLGDSWAPLAPGTLAHRKRLGQRTAPLKATGALERSLSGGKGKRGGATKTMARAGTSVWYGVFAQAGTEKAGHGASAPQRRIVGMTKKDVLKGTRVIEKFLLTGQVF